MWAALGLPHGLILGSIVELQVYIPAESLAPMQPTLIRKSAVARAFPSTHWFT